MVRTLVLLLAATACCRAAQADDAATAAEPVVFSKHIAPLLVKHCLACHGTQEAKSDYRVVNFESTIKPGASGDAVVVPGKPDESQLLLLIASTDADVRMPKEADPLPADAVAAVRRWIDEGAKFDAADPTAPLAGLIPKTVHPDPPEQYRAPLPITALAFSPDGAWLAVSGYREVTLWNAADGTLVRRIKNVAERTFGLAFNPAGNLLAVAGGVPGQLGEVRLYDPAQGTLVRDLAAMSDVAQAVAFSPDGTKLAASSADRSIRIFDVAAGTQSVLIEDHADWVLAIAWSADGTKLVSASRDKTSKVFDATNGEAQVTYSGHGQTVNSACFNADGSEVYSAGADRKIHQWKVADAAKTGEIAGYGYDVNKVLMAAGQVYSASSDKTVRQHTVEKREQVRALSGHNDWVYALDLHVPSGRLASGSFDGEVRIWNTADGAAILTFRAAPGLPLAK